MNERPVQFNEAVHQPCIESDEQREQREQHRRIEILKNWDIRIQVFDRGCVVHVGCKSIAFHTLEKGMEAVNHYARNPIEVARQYGFENHI
jgi:hypothetical protein